jgi:hypothetical protein
MGFHGGGKWAGVDRRKEGRLTTNMRLLAICLGLAVFGAAGWSQTEALSDGPDVVELDSAFRIGKVHEFLNDPSLTSAGKSEAIAFEFKYINHGAVTAEQLRQRKGHYFLFNWSNSGPPADVVIRFDYRQKKTQEVVRSLEVPFSQAKGGKKVKFSVTGDAYESYGLVNSWRLSVVRDGKIIAQKTSFIW